MSVFYVSSFTSVDVGEQGQLHAVLFKGSLSFRADTLLFGKITEKMTPTDKRWQDKYKSDHKI